MEELTTLTIPAEHPALAGHFPGEPILPGVVLLDEMVRTVESAAGAGHWRIGSAKFVRPVRAGMKLQVLGKDLHASPHENDVKPPSVSQIMQ